MMKNLDTNFSKMCTPDLGPMFQTRPYSFFLYTKIVIINTATKIGEIGTVLYINIMKNNALPMAYPQYPNIRFAPPPSWRTGQVFENVHFWLIFELGVPFLSPDCTELWQRNFEKNIPCFFPLIQPRRYSFVKRWKHQKQNNCNERHHINCCIILQLTKKISEEWQCVIITNIVDK